MNGHDSTPFRTVSPCWQKWVLESHPPEALLAADRLETAADITANRDQALPPLDSLYGETHP
ncbi:hypothetical protein [Rhizobium sullae]|uniref:hypothetical protein n=1 Tax=Rhizobium sullae TaxID=50338 RepID=UPI0010457122|nr:hypothetical protein [Rhizobium sullae]